MKLLKLFFLTIALIAQIQAAEDVRQQLTNLVNSAFAKAKKSDHYISLAARNKMLSQQIAKDAVKIVTKVESVNARKEIIEHANEFDHTINAFINGDPTIKVEALSTPLAKKQLGEIVAIWKPFYKSVKELASSKRIDTNAFLFIYRNNEPLLGLSHKLTQTLKSQRSFKTTFSPIIEHTLKFLDRQRFLTQKMLKEKLLIYRGIDASRNSVRLNGSITLFEHGLKGMLHGDKKRGLIAITDKKIRAKLLLLEKKWEEVRDIYKFKKENLTKEDIAKLNRNNKELLALSQDLVDMVEKSLGI